VGATTRLCAVSGQWRKRQSESAGAQCLRGRVKRLHNNAFRSPWCSTVALPNKRLDPVRVLMLVRARQQHAKRKRRSPIYERYPVRTLYMGGRPLYVYFVRTCSML
jgi:hypothetical protein